MFVAWCGGSGGDGSEGGVDHEHPPQLRAPLNNRATESLTVDRRAWYRDATSSGTHSS